MKIKKEDYIAIIKDSVKVREEVFEAIIDWMIENNAYAGEVVMQSDKCVIGAPQLLSNIIDDIIKPEVKYNETI